MKNNIISEEMKVFAYKEFEDFSGYDCWGRREYDIKYNIFYKDAIIFTTTENPKELVDFLNSKILYYLKDAK